MTTRSYSLAISLLAALLGAGCASYPVNDPTDTTNLGQRVEFMTMRDKEKRSNDTLMLMTFSGGGTRAASLSYGVLKALSETSLSNDDPQTTLLDEVDLISSVSGGSFTAAYYALYGDRIFDEFEGRFLKQNIQGALFGQVMRPYNWFRLASTTFSRSDLAAELYDDRLFKNATFGDLASRTSTAVLINATDSVAGTGFSFRQPQFDLLCSDLSTYPVARAVAASSAVPGAFGAITLKNYAGQCDYVLPDWVDGALAARQTYSDSFIQAERIASYMDATKRPYIHLLDGGLSDNLGVRALTDQITILGGILNGVREGDLEKIKRIVVVIVNAETDSEIKLNSLQRLPLPAQLRAASSIPIYRYNQETVGHLVRTLDSWQKSIHSLDCNVDDPDPSCQPIKTHMIEVNFNSIPDEERKQYFKTIATSFKLSDDEVDDLVNVAGEILRDSTSFQTLVEELK